MGWVCCDATGRQRSLLYVVPAATKSALSAALVALYLGYDACEVAQRECTLAYDDEPVAGAVEIVEGTPSAIVPASR